MSKVTVRRTAKAKNTKDGSRLTFYEKAKDIQTSAAGKLDKKNEKKNARRAKR